jgi:hypothetical protein
LWRESGIRSRCNAVVREARVPAEHDTGRAEPEPGEVDSEGVRVVFVVRVQTQTLEQRRDGAQPSCHQLPAADKYLDYGTRHRHRTHAG